MTHLLLLGTLLFARRLNFAQGWMWVFRQRQTWRGRAGSSVMGPGDPDLVACCLSISGKQ